MTGPVRSLLATAAPALQKTPYLAAHLMLKEAGR